MRHAINIAMSQIVRVCVWERATDAQYRHTHTHKPIEPQHMVAIQATDAGKQLSPKCSLTFDFSEKKKNKRISN